MGMKFRRNFENRGRFYAEKLFSKILLFKNKKIIIFLIILILVAVIIPMKRELKVEILGGLGRQEHALAI